MDIYASLLDTEPAPTRERTAVERPSGGALGGAVSFVRRQWRVALFLWALNLGVALLAVAPAAIYFIPELSHRTDLGLVGQGFDPQWLAEILYSSRFAPVTIGTPLLLCLLGIAVLTGPLLYGGWLAVCRGERFWNGLADYGPPLLRLAVWSALLLAIILAINAGLAAISRALLKSSVEERPVAIASWLRASVLLLLWLLVSLVTDYAKARCVLNRRRDSFRVLRESIAFVIRHSRRTIRPYAILCLLGLAVLLLYNWLAESLPPNGTASLLLLLLVRQLFSFFRVCLRFTALATACRVWQRHDLSASLTQH